MNQRVIANLRIGAGGVSRVAAAGVALVEGSFPHHRLAALALLNECPELPHKAAGFCGHVAVTPKLTERQRAWLVKLLQRYELPSIVGAPESDAR